LIFGLFSKIYLIACFDPYTNHAQINKDKRKEEKKYKEVSWSDVRWRFKFWVIGILSVGMDEFWILHGYQYIQVLVGTLVLGGTCEASILQNGPRINVILVSNITIAPIYI